MASLRTLGFGKTMEKKLHSVDIRCAEENLVWRIETADLHQHH